MPTLSMIAGLIENSKNSFMQKLENIVLGLLAIIPQIIYFIYTSVASLLDVCQLLLRKLAGLDVYYVDGTAREGDILKDFIEGILGINKNYSALSTVFWSMLVFGVIILVLATIFSLIKSHYNYDSEKSHPYKIIGNSLKSLALMAATPLIVLFGVYISQVFLTAIDSITTSHQTESIAGVFESDAITNLKTQTARAEDDTTVYYASFDMYGITEWTNSSTFSGVLFDLVAHSANRVRLGSYSAPKTSANGNWDSCEIFFANISEDDKRQEKVAYQIDYAFENCLGLANPQRVQIEKSEASTVIASTLTYGPSAAFAAGLIRVEYFSKFNVGLVWYYYNLWVANYFLGFAGCIACLALFTSLIFGLMKRLIFCIILFLANAPIIGISPLDGGNGIKEWKKSMLSYFLSVFGAIVGINLFFLILPYLNSISFFGPGLEILDKIFDMIIIIAGLVLIKNIVKLVSTFMGVADLADEGAKAKKEAGTIGGKALRRTFATARVGVKLGVYAATGGIFRSTIKTIGEHRRANELIRQGKAWDKKDALRQVREFDRTHPGKIKSGILKAAGKAGNAVAIAAQSRFSQTALNFLGVDVKTGKEEEKIINQENARRVEAGLPQLTDKEKKIIRGQSLIKKAGNYVFDFTGSTLSVLNAGAGLSDAMKNLKNKGILDEGKLVVQDVFQIADFKPDPESKLGKKVVTEDQKDERKKAKEAAYRKDVQENAYQSRQVASKIFEISEAVKKK